MGCDIHLHVERRIGDSWVALKTPYTRYDQTPAAPAFGGWYQGRNYELFAYLADVRNDGTVEPIPWGRPDQLPEDVSAELRSIHTAWRSDAHSAGWYTLAELRKFRGWKPSLAKVDLCFYKLVNRMGRLGPPDGIRIIFWFDN